MTMESIRCPFCIEDTDLEYNTISVLSWVCPTGEVLEAAGDYNTPPKGEPPQLAYCDQCEKYFRPGPDSSFTIENGKPVLRREQS